MHNWRRSVGSSAEYYDFAEPVNEGGVTVTVRRSNGKPEWLTMSVHINNPSEFAIRVAKLLARLSFRILQLG